MPLPLPLLPTSFLDSQGNVNKAWYDFLVSLAGSRAWVVPEHLMFSSEADRDAYFSEHQEELVVGLKVCTDSALQEYNGEEWVDMTTFIQGEKGDTGATGSQGPRGEQGDPSNTISVQITPTWTENIATISDEDWNTYDEFVVEYNGAVVTFNKNYSTPVQYAQGNGAAYSVVMNPANHTIVFNPVTESFEPLIIPSTQEFLSTNARDAYFPYHMSELARCPYCTVSGTFYTYSGSLETYDSTAWTESNYLVRGPRGIQGTSGPRGLQGEQGPQGEQGEQGDSVVVTVLANTGLTYRLRFTTGETVVDTPNLIGTAGDAEWQPAVELASGLPIPTEGAWSPVISGWTEYDSTKTYLSYVRTAANDQLAGVYMLNAGNTVWSYLGDLLNPSVYATKDYVDAVVGDIESLIEAL